MANFKDVAGAATELAVTLGIIEAAIATNGDETPSEVEENLGEKAQEIVDYLERQTQEIMGFGEAYDRD